MAEFRGWAEAMADGAQRAGMEPAVLQQIQQVDIFQDRRLNSPRVLRQPRTAAVAPALQAGPCLSRGTASVRYMSGPVLTCLTHVCEPIDRRLHVSRERSWRLGWTDGALHNHPRSVLSVHVVLGPAAARIHIALSIRMQLAQQCGISTWCRMVSAPMHWLRSVISVAPGLLCGWESRTQRHAI